MRPDAAAERVSIGVSKGLSSSRTGNRISVRSNCAVFFSIVLEQTVALAMLG